MDDFILLSGPRGAGKGMLVGTIGETFPHLKRMVCHTTRPMRENEINGVHYHFLDLAAYCAERKAGKFLWDEPYGLNQRSALSIDELRASAIARYADVHPPGARQLRAFANHRGNRALLIAVLAPLRMRRARIRKRQPTLTEADVDRLISEDSVPTYPEYFDDYDLVIHNNGRMESAQAKTIDAVRRLLERADLKRSRSLFFYCYYAAMNPVRNEGGK